MNLMAPELEQYMASPIGGTFMAELNKIKMLVISVLKKAGLIWLGLFYGFSTRLCCREKNIIVVPDLS